MIARILARGLPCAGARAAAVLLVPLLFGVSAPSVVSSQDRANQPAVDASSLTSSKFMVGQNIAPSFEGWEENPDGTFNMVFGYFNRNWEEQPDIPVGPNNTVEPGGPDRGQPTHFYPRRNKFMFRVPVPRDFGSKELVWTLTVNGKTERAYATLKPDYLLDRIVLQTLSHMNLRGYGMKENIPPDIELEGGANRTVKVGEPLGLNAVVHDDGLLHRKRTPNRRSFDETAQGLRVAWFVYRGPADKVTFDPGQFTVYPNYDPKGNSPWTSGWVPPPLPPNGKFPVTVTFNTAGTFVVRLSAHDGGFNATKDVTVTVTP